MKVTFERKPRNTVKLSSLRVGEAAIRTGSGIRFNPIMHRGGSPDGEVVVRVKPCNFDKNCVAAEEKRDTCVFNLRTGSVWFADGNEDVIPVEVTAIVTAEE